MSISSSGCAAGYNVPLGGALFALEVLLGTVALPLVLPALATSVTATAVAWITLGTGPTYRLPPYALHPTQMAWAVLVGPLIGVFFGSEPVTDYEGATKSAATGRYPGLMHGLLERGVAIAPGAYEIFFPSLAHTDADMERTVEAFGTLSAFGH